MQHMILLSLSPVKQSVIYLSLAWPLQDEHRNNLSRYNNEQSFYHVKKNVWKRSSKFKLIAFPDTFSVPLFNKKTH